MKSKILFLLLALVIAVSTVGGIYAFASDESLEASAVSEEATAPKASFYGATLVLSNTIQIRYIVNIENVSDYNDISVLVWKNAPNEYVSGTQDYTLTYSGKTTNIGGGVKLPSFDFNGVGPQKLADDFYAVVALKTESGIEYSSPAKYGVLNYAYGRFGKLGNAASTDENLVLLLEEMLDYGAASQKYTKYKTDRLATSDFYQIKTAGGKLPDGFTSGFYLEGEKVTLTATDKNAAGEVFICWADAEGNFLSKDKSFEIAVANKNDSYTAVYGECINHVFGEWYIETEETCTENGLDKRVCTVCDKVETNERAALGHTEVIDYGVEPTCTTNGISEGKHCSVCDETLVAQTIIRSPGHSKVNHEGKAATCLESGYAAYVTCTKCDYTTYKEIEALGHNYINGVCLNCGDVEYSAGLAYTKNSDGTYTVSGIGTCTDTRIVIPATYNGAQVVAIGAYAFRECTSLTSIEIPDSVTEIGEWAFYYCKSLMSIEIPDSVTAICTYAFRDCTSLTSVEIGDSVTVIGKRAFNNCTNLTSIVIPDSVTTIGEDAFTNCHSLASVVIGDSVTTIGSFTFENCTSLTSVVIPDSVTTIGNNAFRNCTNLTSIVIPDSVTTIGSMAFYGCSKLTGITFEDTTAWYCTTSSGYSGGTQTDVTSASTNATYFKSRYCDCYWYKV